MPARRSGLALVALSTWLAAQHYAPPAGDRPAIRRAGTAILPGGRVISPAGEEYVTGPGPFGIALSPSGKILATANGGPYRFGFTILERGKQKWDVRQVTAHPADGPDQSGENDWHSVSTGIVFAGERSLYVSEGNSGRISQFDSNDERRHVIDLNQGGYRDSYSGDLAYDNERNILYAVDQGNARVAVVDLKTRQVVESIKVGRLPFAMALSPDQRKLYVTNLGRLDYHIIPHADPGNPAASGLMFPAFGFPSAEALSGGERKTARGPVQVPGLGDPNDPQSDSLCIVDVATPAAAKVEAFLRTGRSPSGVVATEDRVYVSNAGSDSITVVDPKKPAKVDEIPIRIPGLEQLRGVTPIGLAYYPKSGWILAAEAGINAVGIIEPSTRRVLGHIPAAWFPTRVAVDQDTLFVLSARGQGQGPSASPGTRGGMWFTQRYQGSVAIFPIPPAESLASQTQFVMQANGFESRPAEAGNLPKAIRHVVLIVKEGRSYDEVLGDIPSAGNGPALGAPELARLGSHGFVDGRHTRMSLRDANITPNQHAIARQWAFSDNFYADGDSSIEGHRWLAGVYPNAWSRSSSQAAMSGLKDFRLGAPGRLAFSGTAASVHPEDESDSGTLWSHLAAHGVSFRNFGEGIELAGVSEGPGMRPIGARYLTNTPMPQELYARTSREYPGFNIHISDQQRVTQFIRELDDHYVNGGEELPAFLYLYLPADYAGPARPDDGYPYEESFIADNDYAVGRVLQYLSGTKWWGSTTVFVTEAAAQGGLDHIDAHRTNFIIAGAWVKSHYVSHTNSDFPGLVKTIFELLGIPSLNLFDASAADLSDCFAIHPNPAPFHDIAPDPRIFNPAAAAEKGVNAPSAGMHDSQPNGRALRN